MTHTQAALFAVLMVAGTAIAQQPREPHFTDTKSLVEDLSIIKSSLSSLDSNGDGVVSDIDIILWAHDKPLTSELQDMDSDGVLTAADVVLSIRQAILTTMSDPDGDGLVSINDALKVAEQIASAFPDLKIGDINGDGIVNIDDLNKVIEHLNQEVLSADYPMDLAQRIFNGLDWGASLGFDRLRLAAVDVHNTLISQDWNRQPPAVDQPRSHWLLWSKERWPANHYYDVSQWWLPDPSFPSEPSHNTESSKSWPPNHRIDVTASWTRPQFPAGHNGTVSARRLLPSYHSSDFTALIPTHDRDQSTNLIPPTHEWQRSKQFEGHPNHKGTLSWLWPATHSTDASQQWPSNHLTEVSVNSPSPLAPAHNVIVTSYYPAQHATTVSANWPTTHLANISVTWPPNHTTTVSGTFPPNHILYFSADRPPSHGAEFSSIWPPNHGLDLSRTWINHDVRQSIAWPAQHGRQISSTWTPPGYRGWPPNHDFDVSRRGGTPPVPFWNPPTQFWPNGHNWFTTLKEAIPMIPTIPRPPA